MKCKYEGCNNDTFENFDLCILHIELPEDEKSEEFKKIDGLKNAAIRKKIDDKDFNFKGVKLSKVNFSGIETENDIIFTSAVIKGDVKFSKATIGRDAWFDRSKIVGNFDFDETKVYGSVSFYGVQVSGYVSFDQVEIGRYLWFEMAKIDGEFSLNWANVGGSVSFQRAKINGNASFNGANIEGNAWFNESQIEENAWFDLTKIKGELSFKGTSFKNPKTQEKTCRKAKTIWEKLGDRENADYHFYREMEAKRKQKSFYIKYLELIVQYPFGYGVYPYRLLFTFALTLVVFAFIYWSIERILTVDSLIENIRFSFLTMIIPAYGVIKAKTGIYGIFAIIEAVIGAFTWPTFIVAFARKYMR